MTLGHTFSSSILLGLKQRDGIHPGKARRSINMSLWVDKVSQRSEAEGGKRRTRRDERASLSQYRPRTLDDLHYHDQLANRLKSLVSGSYMVIVATLI